MVSCYACCAVCPVPSAWAVQRSSGSGEGSEASRKRRSFSCFNSTRLAGQAAPVLHHC